jgi:hypothetical protein
VNRRTRLILNLTIRLLVGSVFAALARTIAEWSIATWAISEGLINGVLGLSVALVFAFLIFPLIGKKQRPQ